MIETSAGHSIYESQYLIDIVSSKDMISAAVLFRVFETKACIDASENQRRYPEISALRS